MFDQVTVVVGVDAKTIEYLKVSCETWRRHRPEMWQMPWVIFWDWTQLDMSQMDILMRQLDVPNLRVVGWPTIPNADYNSQREKMLSGHVWVPALAVNTPWHMKIDCDALALEAMREFSWLRPEWFENDEFGRTPVYVAPRWHYTKGVNFLGMLEAWGDSAFPAKFPRLNIPFDPTHLRVPHQRMCSWCSYYLTDFTRDLADRLEVTCGNGKLPIPSQDSVVWYAAARMLQLHRIVNMKLHGWTNCPKLHTLKEVAARALNTDHAARMVDA